MHRRGSWRSVFCRPKLDPIPCIHDMHQECRWRCGHIRRPGISNCSLWLTYPSLCSAQLDQLHTLITSFTYIQNGCRRSSANSLQSVGLSSSSGPFGWRQSLTIMSWNYELWLCVVFHPHLLSDCMVSI